MRASAPPQAGVPPGQAADPPQHDLATISARLAALEAAAQGAEGAGPKSLLKGRKPSVELIPLAKVLCAAVFEVANFSYRSLFKFTSRNYGTCYLGPYPRHGNSERAVGAPGPATAPFAAVVTAAAAVLAPSCPRPRRRGGSLARAASCFPVHALHTAHR